MTVLIYVDTSEPPGSLKQSAIASPSSGDGISRAVLLKLKPPLHRAAAALADCSAIKPPSGAALTPREFGRTRLAGLFLPSNQRKPTMTKQTDRPPADQEARGRGLVFLVIVLAIAVILGLQLLRLR
jgi:hypothetical protein